MNQLESHRKEIENGAFKSFSVRIGWSRNILTVSWQVEEFGQPLSNGQTTSLRR